MLELCYKLVSTKLEADPESYQQQIETTDRQIDALVSELYGLSEEEIEIIEASA